jgi:diaminopropionate ammonia-lyase
VTSWYARDARDWTCAAPGTDAARFHRQLPGYAPTPLVEIPELAAELGVGRLFAKDESARFDLRAFKFLGASWAGFLAVSRRTGYAGSPGLTGLRAHLAGRSDGLSLVTATDGNHGRAVARTARLLGLPARVYVPASVPAIVLTRISAERAVMIPVDGTYDAAVAAARAEAGSDRRALLIQDTAWAGYEEVPGWIVDGYETLFAELDTQLAACGVGAAGAPAPALVSVPVGVGSLAQAAVAHYRREALPAAARPRLLSAEPVDAACVLTSLAAGSAVAVPTGDTVMNGLNCGTPSSLAWPYLRDGLDAAIAVDDTEAARAVTSLAAAGIAAGPSGAASFAALRAALTGPGAVTRRRDLGLGVAGEQATVVCLCTEGPLSELPGDHVVPVVVLHEEAPGRQQVLGGRDRPLRRAVLTGQRAERVQLGPVAVPAVGDLRR